MLQVKVDTNNDAFQADRCISEDAFRTEAARILRLIADHIELGEYTGKFQTVFDINGNDVGRWKLSRD